MDRNPAGDACKNLSHVALRKESVDRNKKTDVAGAVEILSLSARRAWIEIGKADVAIVNTGVALRKESVDRNRSRKWLCGCSLLSLSARRAWIEIVHAADEAARQRVALRKESVDRNHNSVRRCLMSVGRSPQGERG